MEGPNFYELEPPAAAAVPAPGCCRKRRNGNFRPHTHRHTPAAARAPSFTYTVVVEENGGAKAKEYYSGFF